MTLRKILTPFTYETAAFEVSRFCVSRARSYFTKHLSDKRYGETKKVFATAENTKEKLLKLAYHSRRMNSKFSKA